MRRALLGAWFLLVVGLGLFSRWYVFGRRVEHCSLDGGRIEEIYRVDMILAGTIVESFCCVRCASEWPAVPDGVRWNVRDEIHGGVLDAEKAIFVRSSVVTVPARQARTHVFEHWPDASSHAAEYGGDRIPNPLEAGSTGEPLDQVHEQDQNAK